MVQNSDDMRITSMRIRRRTTRYIEYLKGVLQVRTGRDYSPDDVVWEALNKAFGKEMHYMGEMAEDSEDEHSETSQETS